MGRTPIIGHVIREFLPWQHLLTYLEAILRVYNRYGRRDNKYKARIKILVKALGVEEFTRQVEAEWAAHARTGPRTLTDEEFDARRRALHARPPTRRCPPSTPRYVAGAAPTAAPSRAGPSATCTPHKVPGYAAVTLSLKKTGVPPGDATAEQMDGVADLADRYSFGELRVTHEQNLVLADVRKRDLLRALAGGARPQGLATPNIGLLTNIICCPGGDFCSLANAKSIPIAEAIQRRFDDLDYLHDIGELDLNISGCMNACGHHHVGHIGILGVDKNGDEWYQVSIGGAPGQRGRARQGDRPVVRRGRDARRGREADRHLPRRAPRGRALHRHRAPRRHRALQGSASTATNARWPMPERVIRNRRASRPTRWTLRRPRPRTTGRAAARRPDRRAARRVAGAARRAARARASRIGVWLEPDDDPAALAADLGALRAGRGPLPEVHRRPRLLDRRRCCARASATAASCAPSATSAATSSSTSRAAASTPSRCAPHRDPDARAREPRTTSRDALPGLRRRPARRSSAGAHAAGAHAMSLDEPRRPRARKLLAGGREELLARRARLELRRRGHGAARPHRARRARDRDLHARHRAPAAARPTTLIDRVRKRLRHRRSTSYSPWPDRVEAYVARARPRRLLRQRRAAQGVLRACARSSRCAARSPASAAGSRACAASSPTRAPTLAETGARRRRTACGSSTRSPTGPRPTSGTTCAPTTCPTTRCTTAAIPSIGCEPCTRAVQARRASARRPLVVGAGRREEGMRPARDPGQGRWRQSHERSTRTSSRDRSADVARRTSTGSSPKRSTSCARWWPRRATRRCCSRAARTRS